MHCTSLVIYDDDVCFHIYLTCVVSFLSLYTPLVLYNLCIFHTQCLNGSCLVFQLRQATSLSYCDLSSCKVFQDFIVFVRLM